MLFQVFQYYIFTNILIQRSPEWGKGPYEYRRVSFFFKEWGKKSLSVEGAGLNAYSFTQIDLCVSEDSFSTCSGSHLDQPPCDKKSVRLPRLSLSHISIPFGLPEFCQLQKPKLMFLSLYIFLQPREMFAQAVAQTG